MKKKKNRKRIIITILFIVIEILFYITLLYLDIYVDHAGNISNYIKFTSILLCFLYSLMNYKNISLEKKDMTHKELPKSSFGNHVLKTALFFTVVSDVFLLLLDYYSIGISTFILVQFLYLIRISTWVSSGKVIKSVLLKTIGSGLVAALILVIYHFWLDTPIQSEIALGAFYFTLFLSNVIDGIGILFRSKKTYRILFACGLLAYFICDINVALFNLTDYLTINNSIYAPIYQFSSIAMWAFYLPGQVAIALSGEMG